MFPNDERNVAADPNDQISPENSASDILRCHYETLSKHLLHLINVAQLLCKEKVITDETLSLVLDNGRSELDKRTILLRAIRHAIRMSNDNLAKFASVLNRFTENVQVGIAIFNDYG